ncbi:MAG TPA: hypothetical protein VF415_09835 [Rhodanobacter sp.]
MTNDMPRRHLRKAVANAWLTAALLMVMPAFGTDMAPPDVKISAVLDGGGVRTADVTQQRGGAVVETIWLKGDHVRVDFDGGPRLRGRILRNGAHAWLLQPGVDRVLPADHVTLGSLTRLDPQKPCWNLGFTCERVDDRLIAGRRASGWHYSHAGHAGPNGTDSGVFWIDAQNGVLLAFDARDTGRRDYRMDTVTIDFTDLPNTTFEPPQGMRTALEAVSSPP